MDSRCSLWVIKSMVSNFLTLRIESREVHEIDVVVVLNHRFYLSLCWCFLQEDVAINNILCIYALGASSRSATHSAVAGIYPYRLSVFIVNKVTRRCIDVWVTFRACSRPRTFRSSLCRGWIRTVRNGIFTARVNVVVTIKCIVTECTTHVDWQ